MTVIVIDASSLAKYLLHEENWDKIEAYLLRTVHSIDHVLKEVSNAIWKHVYVYRRIPIDLGLELYDALRRLVKERIILLERQELYLDEAFRISLNRGLSIYDSLYIAQALKFGELLTSDVKQAKEAEELGLRVHLVE